MSAKQESVHSDAERESRQVAEAARETEWKQPSFMRELFLGNFRPDLIHPFPTAEQRPEFTEFFDKFKQFVRENVDPADIDRTGEYPQHVLDGLTRLGAFGMKIAPEYGGLGLSQAEFSRVFEFLGALDGNLSALLSAHQSIGLPQPLKLFGTPEQRQKYLPRCAAGAISAFALTETSVGSDPAMLTTTAELTPDGDAYILNGRKLWCTNGTLAELLVVMARNPETKKISAFIVETSWPGVRVEHRCRFMGLRALANADMSFTDVRVPRENLIGGEGKGLKIALITLNTGRLTLPACSTGTAKRALEICREWANERVQWGAPIGKHEAIGHKLADMAATTFAMESVNDLASQMADRGGYDIRLEAAAAKEWNTVEGWRIVDDTMQIRSGRGYETEQSLAGRGERPIGVERMMRDHRINLIFEGSSEIMHLFMAREAVDRHLSVAGGLIDPRKPAGAKLAALPGVVAFYAWWYPTRWLGWGRWPRFGAFGRLARHMRFAERNCRKLARQIFHGMVVHGPKLEKKQASLFRLVDVANELFAMAASISRARRMADDLRPEARKAAQIVDLFCRNSRRRVRRLFNELWSNDDTFKYRVSREVLDGEHEWLETGILPGDQVDLLARPAAEEPIEAEVS
jgi:alkylation response protein AidB-like acyl-CoA dehydrogenase